MNFDLDIKNYTKNDIEKLLDLNFPYYHDQVEDKCTLFKNSLINNSNLDKSLISNVSEFLDQAKGKLFNSLSENNNQMITQANFEMPTPPESRVLNVGSTPIIERQLRTNEAYNSNTTSLSSGLSYPMPRDAAPGIMNPLYKRSISKTLTVDSRFRENYYNTVASDYQVNLPTTFNDVFQIQLAEIELPITFYAISKQLGNNYFWIRLSHNLFINL